MRRKSIVAQTVWRVSLFFIILIALLAFGFTYFISTYMKNSILETKRSQVETVANVCENKLDNMMGPIISLAEYTPTIRLVTGYYPEYSSDWMNAIRNVDAYLQNVSMFTNYIVDINLVKKNSECVYSLNDILRKDYGYCDAEWFTSAMQQKTIVKYAPPHGTDHLYRDNVGETFSMIYPIKSVNTICGYIVVECKLLEVADFLKESYDDSEQFLILDPENKRIYPNSSGDNELYNLSSEMQQITYENNKVYITEQLDVNGWKIVLESNLEFMLKPIQQLVISILVMAVLAFVFLITLTAYNAKVLKKPFDVLINRISSYDGSGAREIVEYGDAPQEVAVIGERFELMADKMNDLIQDVYVAELEKKEAELEALMNQINPHFLYNVFQLIQTKAVLSDNREIEDMIQALSQMMRYTMERKVDKVRISEELAYIQNYLMFYKTRFPKLFEYEIDCPKECENYYIIKFILQPVVENCFKHAFDRQKSGGLLKITIRPAGEDLVLEVYDNGRGMTLERLEEISKRLTNDKYDGGIGVVNTNARIRLCYGDNYGITFKSEIDQFTCVTLRVRIEEM